MIFVFYQKLVKHLLDIVHDSITSHEKRKGSQLSCLTNQALSEDFYLMMLNCMWYPHQIQPLPYQVNVYYSLVG